MERRILIGGFGGQGVMMIGQLLSYTACETTDKNVLYFPSYGSEQRGGTANCYVTISDEQIGGPVGQEIDNVIVLNEPSLLKFEERVKPGGLLFMNSSIIKAEPKRDDITVIRVPANEVAEEIGSGKIANLVMLGTYIGYTDALPEENVLATALKKLGAKRPWLNEMNEKAFRTGLAYGKEQKSRA
ncbi:MAG: 2-oxoacid:acceptor oxidoreductase family protein [Lachnospiraceae bacterium]|nr:2-oxoacid:acceptor oxidoreductase family protein [Lachnospiraceae bacterium]